MILNRETLLFLLEFLQSKQMIVNCTEYLIRNDEERQHLKDKMMATRSRFSISNEILNIDNDVHLTISDCIKIWIYLYEQYIDLQSMNCVNISSNVRHEIQNTFAKYNFLGNNNEKVDGIVMISTTSSDDGGGDDVDVIYDEKEDDNDKDNGDKQLSNMILDVTVAFQSVADNMFKLLRQDSWRRFQLTVEYKEHLGLMNERKRVYIE